MSVRQVMAGVCRDIPFLQLPFATPVGVAETALILAAILACQDLLFRKPELDVVVGLASFKLLSSWHRLEQEN